MLPQRTLQRFLKTHKIAVYAGAIAITLFVVIAAVRFGSVGLSFPTVFFVLVQEGLNIPLGQELDPGHVQIILHIRLPRVLLALFVGACLAVAGAAFQGLLRNPLADPYTLGVSSGAALGAVAVLFFQLAFLGAWTLPLVAMGCGFLTLVAVLYFTKILSPSLQNETVVLAGIIASAFLGAGLSLMIAMSQDELRQVINWLMGSVAMRGWAHIGLLLPFFVGGFTLLFFCRNELNAFMYGEETAQHLGVYVVQKKYIILIAATILTGSAVAVSGTIGFVGLVVPHMCRTLFGSDYSHLLPLAAIVGGSFLVVCDMAARVVVSPAELPIGVVTALIGAPTFAWMLYRSQRAKRRDQAT
ncbi:iron ABC transporter permease [Bacillus sp. FSL R5-0394]